MIPYKQLSLKDIFTDCQKKFEHDKPAFLSLLERVFTGSARRCIEMISERNRNKLINIDMGFQ